MNDDRQNDPKYDFKAPEDNMNKWEPKKWENQAFQGVSPFDFAMRQKNEEKKRKEREREAKAKMYSYQAKGVSTLAEENAKQVNAQYKQSKEEARRNKEEATKVQITGTVETAVRAEQFGQEKAWKATKKAEIDAQKNVNITGTVETAVRAEQFGQEKAWKATKKNEIDNLKNITITETVETNVRGEFTETGRESGQFMECLLFSMWHESILRSCIKIESIGLRLCFREKIFVFYYY